ncbi:UDP-glucose 4-epimerase [Barrientosiimonas humi]|uniref:UDP-glucose 4-epimerase n=2 Tax=Barrientosiimonas TaxID=1535207 RepID=A0A542WZ88_9MICO|nr:MULTISPECIES: UDP-glucose 4-epimerase GalE [Barrientosiimonas]TQL28899.1 UDP-glucose 4-epimerase [Barrientosiimonas humi]BDZ56352.1 UDP-glucose 4-epimerase [Barrientosiimonas endolithica]BDZ60184.1 UDP-glucose 4-epimerase [Barrientosiimonas endolithica]CAG7571256.1 UDP-glucose 4-epimerase [Barrientosiimonas humi]
MRVLVSGGAGYIGSHTVLALLGAGHDVVVVDDFSNSKPTVVNRLESLSGKHIPLHGIDLTDRDKTDQIFSETEVDAVVHFAGLKAVGESVEKPLEYYENNLDSTFSLVRAMRRHGVGNLVFSSSATVYGPNAPLPYSEEWWPLESSNPYGWTKVFNEQVLRDVAATTPGMKVALLRYFNPIGAHPSGQIGEDPSGIPNNLVPYIAQVAVGRRDLLKVYGDDYDTPDGTCLRDYIHVEDLAAGHLAALEHLARQEDSARAYNLGTGQGTSVMEVLRAFERAVGHDLPHEIAPRRAGDLPATYADPTRAERELGWKATKTIDDMCVDTWRWQSANPHGYPDA